ncbi:MAG: hypothetical protein KIT77_08145 [Caldilinea sp.]|nr:hypothetical protein [Caldilinea sp.]
MFAAILALTFLSIASIFSPVTHAQDTTPRDTRTWTEPGSNPVRTFTFSTPDIFDSCSTRGDRIWTIGLQPGWSLDGTVRVRLPNNSVTFSTIDVNQNVDLNLLVPYPPVSQWQNNGSNREIHVDISIAVLDENGFAVDWIGDEPTAPGVLGPRQQDWDVFCIAPQTPDIAIKKYTNGADADNPAAAGVPLIAPGAPVTWTYRLTNNGPVDIPFADISVTDNIAGVNPVFSSVISGDLKGDGNGLLQPNEVWEYVATGTALNLSSPPAGFTPTPNACQQGQTVPGRNAYVNIGTVTIPNTSDTDPSSYCNPAASVSVAKTAVTSFTRTYTWEIAKSVSPAVVNLFEGQNANVGYTVQVTRSAPVDSGWQVSGVISVTNTGASAVQLNSVADSISGVGAVTVQCPAALPTSLGAGVTLVCTYSSALPDGTARTNTATATFNTSSTATGTAAVAFGQPTTTVNGSVNVRDVYNGLAPETIGTNLTGNTTIPYTRNVVCGSDLTYVNGVATYPRLNTATIVETNQSANAAMTVNCYRPSVGKTVDPDFTRRFTWQILKTVNPSQINLLDGQSSTATYTVTLTKSAPIDENFRVFGNITITNPHPSASLGITGVTDTLGNGLNATVTCPAQSVPAGSTLVCTYQTNVPNNADGTNTATVTATTGIAYNSPVVPYTFIGLPPSQTTLNSVTVTDTNPATGQPWTFSSSGSRNYQLPFACVDVAYNQNGIFQTTVNNTVVISETGQQSTAIVNLTCRIPQATVSSVCADGVRTWSVIASDSGAYVVEFLVNGNVQSTANLNLTANVASTFSYNGDATTLSGVRVTFNGNVVAQEDGPYESCVTTPTASLNSTCVDNARVWTVNASQSGAYVAQFLVNGAVVASTPLNLVANTNQTFTYNGDATTLDVVRVTFNGTTIAQETGPYESCDTTVRTGVLDSACVNETRTWVTEVTASGTYVAEFLVGTTVVDSLSLDLTANTPRSFNYTGDPTTLSSVRLTYQGTTVVSENGPYESCAPPPAPPKASLAPQCTDQGLVWNVLTDRTGTYTAQVLSNGQVIDSVTLNLTANTPQQFTFTADSTTPNTVRLVYENAAIVTRTGPESCVSGINAALLRQCVGPNLIWSVQTNTTGDYTAQLVGGETVVENVNLSLVNGVEQDFSFTNDAYSPRFVRLLFQGNQYAVLQGPTERCTPTSLPETEEPTGRNFTNYLFLPNVGR